MQTDIPGCIFVDMFSGSGSIGIEALSRGAKKAYFIENNAGAAACIAENITFTKFTEQSVLLKQDCLSALHNIFENEVDIIFMDPPYDLGVERQVLTNLISMKYVTNNTLIIVEALEETDFSYLDELGYELIRVKNYKNNKHMFIQAKKGN